MNETEQVRELLEYVKGVIGRPHLELTGDVPLVSSGLIDSFALVEILAKLEDVTNLKISAGKVQPKDMNTVNMMLSTARRVGKPRKSQ